MAKGMGSTGAAWANLRELALGYPETREDHPWGHLALKVRGKKVFLFLNGPGELAPKALVRRLQTPPRTAPCRGR